MSTYDRTWLSVSSIASGIEGTGTFVPLYCNQACDDWYVSPALPAISTHVDRVDTFAHLKKGKLTIFHRIRFSYVIVFTVSKRVWNSWSPSWKSKPLSGAGISVVVSRFWNSFETFNVSNIVSWNYERDVGDRFLVLPTNFTKSVLMEQWWRFQWIKNWNEK